MALQERLASLKARKSELESQINEEMKRPSFNQNRIAQLKKKKLNLKEEMQRLQGTI